MAEQNIKCPHCNSELTLAEEYIGMEVTCPICSKSFVAAPPPPVVKVVQPAVTVADAPASNLGDRRILQKYFDVIPAESALEEQDNFNLCHFVTQKTYQAFLNVRQMDHDYWTNLDILDRYGQNWSQLVSEPQILTEPVIGLSKTDQMDAKAKVAIFSGQDGEWNLVTNLVYITKIYTFEDQLFVYEAVWDYALGCVWREDTQAFFFKDITNMSTNTIYGSAVQIMTDTPQKKPGLIFGLVLSAVVMVASFAYAAAEKSVTGLLLGVAAVIVLIVLLSNMPKQQVQKRKRSVRRIEQFNIASSSGNSLSISMVSKDWLTVKKNIHARKANWFDGIEQDYTQRSEAEKIIQSIRKMIEEKKVAADA